VLSLWIDRIDPKISGEARHNIESAKAPERAVSDAHKIHPQLSNLEQRQISRLDTIFDAATTHAALCSLSGSLLSNSTSLRNITLPLEECQQLKNFSFSGKDSIINLSSNFYREKSQILKIPSSNMSLGIALRLKNIQNLCPKQKDVLEMI
jgi:hypothetical protein